MEKIRKSFECETGKLGAIKMIPWVKAKATKPDNLNAIPGAHRGGGSGNDSLKLPSDLPVYTVVLVPFPLMHRMKD